MNAEEVTIWTLGLNSLAAQATYPTAIGALNLPMQSLES